MEVSPLQLRLPWGLDLIESVLLLSALPIALILYWDASKREIPRKHAWVGGAVVSGLVPLVGYTIVSLLYFFVNREYDQRVSSTGYLLVLSGLIQGVVVFPYAFGPAQDPFGGILTVLPTAIILIAWHILD